MITIYENRDALFYEGDISGDRWYYQMLKIRLELTDNALNISSRKKKINYYLTIPLIEIQYIENTKHSVAQNVITERTIDFIRIETKNNRIYNICFAYKQSRGGVKQNKQLFNQVLQQLTSLVSNSNKRDYFGVGIINPQDSRTGYWQNSKMVYCLSCKRNVVPEKPSYNIFIFIVLCCICCPVGIIYLIVSSMRSAKCPVCGNKNFTQIPKISPEIQHQPIIPQINIRNTIKYCPYCGHQIEGKFCSNCGSESN